MSAVERLPAMISDDGNVAETSYLTFMKAEQGNQIAMFTSKLISHQVGGEIVSLGLVCVRESVRKYYPGRFSIHLGCEDSGGQEIKKIPIAEIRPCQAFRLDRN